MKITKHIVLSLILVLFIFVISACMLFLNSNLTGKTSKKGTPIIYASVTNVKNLSAGSNASISLELYNKGGSTTSANLTVVLQTLPGPDMSAHTVSSTHKIINIGPNSRKIVTLHLPIGDLPRGTYSLLVFINKKLVYEKLVRVNIDYKVVTGVKEPPIYKKPFTFYVKIITGDRPLHDVYISLDLRDSFRNITPNSFYIKYIPPHKTVYKQWILVPIYEGENILTVYVETENSGSLSIDKFIQVLSPPKLTLECTPWNISIKKGEKFSIRFKVSNFGDVNSSNATLYISSIVPGWNKTIYLGVIPKRSEKVVNITFVNNYLTSDKPAYILATVVSGSQNDTCIVDINQRFIHLI